MTIFDLIRQKIEIYDVVAKHVTLRRLGAYWKGSCPFHFETDASFTISPDKKIFYCFGCHEGGDAVAFTAKIENLPQIEAAQLILKDFSIPIPKELLINLEDLKTNKNEVEILKKTCSVFASWAHQQLLKESHAQQYLIDRGINPATFERFCLGFFPTPEQESIQNLLNFTNKQGILAHNLIDAGIIGMQNQNLWSPFSGRILFPIRESDGKTVGFGGRIFLPNDSRPKYYNSKESSIFHKGSLLFGLDLAKQAARKNKYGFLVEGYMDCIAMSQHGLEECFASLGTACTPTHLKNLSRIITTLYVVYDADRAGEAAVLKLAKNCWDLEIDLKVIILPKGDDPASFIQSGGNIKKLIDASSGIFEFLLQKTNEKFIGASMAQKVELVRDVVKTICQLEDIVKRDLLLLEVSRIFQIPFSTIKKSIIKNWNDSQNPKLIPKPEAELKNSAENLYPEDNINIKSLSQQIFFMHIAAKKDALNGFDFTEDLELCMQGNTSKILTIWKKHAQDVEKSKDFNVFLNNLNENDRTWILKGMLVSEQNLDRNLFLSLIRELKKRTFKQLILNARQSSQVNSETKNCPNNILKKICEFSKK